MNNMLTNAILSKCRGGMRQGGGGAKQGRGGAVSSPAPYQSSFQMAYKRMSGRINFEAHES